MNFLEIDVVKDRSNTWRNLAVIFLIVLALGGLVVKKITNNNKLNLGAVANKQWQKIEKIVLDNNQQMGMSAQAGGDINVKPIEMPKPKLPELIGLMKPVEEFSAQGMIVKDVKTGAVLYRRNEYQQWPMASITKLMSALVILENKPDWATTTVVIGADSLDAHMYAGDTYSLENLWYAGLVGSSNKAILSLANALGWPEPAFISRLNDKARELGMTNTFFNDATGLAAANVSTASDLAILLNEAMKQGKITQALLTKEYNLYSNERQQAHHMWNTDWILLGWIPTDFKEFFGGKTGYITASGYNFAMRVGDGLGHKIDVVVLGTDSHEDRFKEASDIANWVFANYQWPE